MFLFYLFSFFVPPCSWSIRFIKNKTKQTNKKKPAQVLNTISGETSFKKVVFGSELSWNHPSHQKALHRPKHRSKTTVKDTHMSWQGLNVTQTGTLITDVKKSLQRQWFLNISTVTVILRWNIDGLLIKHLTAIQISAFYNYSQMNRTMETIMLNDNLSSKCWCRLIKTRWDIHRM